ncbi:ribonuclease J [Sulfobacillus thermosulfidooxidans]|uniref:Ribonuclease J n=2 Tax=Sulfobacillus thermosulfidooxidans TaxID=28034 RepID=A0A1W1WKE3_SULTA|nr:ribonuclease J [Sulfobacillus thermosulfidooxidans]OLZ12285.1 ribonuclease J [Sulfobacillus thermosulfidooxidans]OLZ12934.1 ribonuclease J [Sulfobacillus thermosulfidooxidans]OLZ21735.1 ribonuclease J [Sulfobacillus thermosulfidooxidans]PSR27688.1 MAG: ribonuclease J [Sulfobacillus thermosulfidooxidans]SMC06629.1 ribonuclease J [Sulfobacillus thermosulfidooxidans DSM 9293]
MGKLARPGPGKLQFIPLGGLGEIGKNLSAVVYGNDIILIDCGLAFPEPDMPGIDLVLPDITYLLENKDRVRAIFLTHGHEDHIGGIPYFLKQIQVPIYGTRLTLGIVEMKLQEHQISLHPKSHPVDPGDTIRVGSFSVEFFRVNHSIPDATGLIIRNPVGTIVHTGDFKFDHTPVDGHVADFHKLAQVGSEGVLLLLADSTNAERPGYTPSEKTVGKTLDRIIEQATGRVLVSSFASQVHRIQQVVESAVRHGRHVAVVGRSMENVVQKATELHYLDFPEGTWMSLDNILKQPANKTLILTTGSQGEPMSALTRMSTSDHKKVEIMSGDTVIISATAIPGNEKMVARTVNNLYRLGAEVYYGPNIGIHVSGHACQEELKLMLNLVKPKFFIPVHGEYRHLVHHAQLAREVGIDPSHVLIGENGTVFELTKDSAQIVGQVPAGKVLVDGFGVGDVGNIVLRDRKQLSNDGILIVVVGMDAQSGLLVSGPDIVSRGFVYVRESEALLDEARSRVKSALTAMEGGNLSEWSAIKALVRDTLGRFLWDRTKRRPMILPIIMEV